jgi:glycosyltransferase involved in cell wall biosynthesis
VLPSVGGRSEPAIDQVGCGTPALVSDETAAGCPEAAAVLLHEALGAADTAARWSARIEALLASPAILHPLRGRVAEFARASWSWERCAERYNEVFRGCATHA